MQYLQECTTNPIAILVVDELWSDVVDIANAIDYTIWKLPCSSTVLFPKIAHILYELPWKPADHVIDVKSDDVELEMAFLEASRREQLCLVNTNLDKKPNIQIALGREIQKSVNQNLSINLMTIVAVPLFADDFSLIKSKRELYMRYKSFRKTCFFRSSRWFVHIFRQRRSSKFFPSFHGFYYRFCIESTSSPYHGKSQKLLHHRRTNR